jgi:phenylpyruvate tautomerase PptA (4-oxalocrotonate tautomerase family)
MTERGLEPRGILVQPLPMPVLTLLTSAEPPQQEKSDALLRDLSASVARVLAKPESYVMTCLEPRSRMTFGGSFEPACLAEIKSIGGLTRETATRLTEVVCKHVHEALGVPPRRTFVVLTDVPAHLWGFDGHTLG